jgi:membrane protease YdiL (CAAX protease family)
VAEERLAGSRLTGSDKLALLLWVLAGIVGTFFAHKYYFRAFPEASVNFQVARDEALAGAQKFVSALGENVAGYKSVTVFEVDDNAKTYLEREVGLQQANQLMSSTLDIWYWDVRFFKPQQEEEFHVRVNPAGKIVGYNHHIEESRPGAHLDRAAAESHAQDFLSKDLGLNLADWDFLPEQSNSTTKPARLDWNFTWEKHAFRAKDAPYRLSVSLQGDRVNDAEPFLKVPDAWTRGFDHLRSSNDFLTYIALIPYLFLLGAAIWLAITFTREGKTTWGFALKISVLVAILLFLMQLNSWPVERASYDTNTSYSTFILLQIVKALGFGVVSVLTIALVLPGAEPLYRSFLPGRLRLAEAFTLRGVRSKEFFMSAVIGLSMAAAHIGFIVAFYIVARHFGAWAPQDLNYENSVNTLFPWISGVAIGFLASTNEEFTFRLFAIPFLHRITRSRILAVLIPAFCWSFLHSNYPQEPAYIRGIEIGIIGVLAGWVMLRWGILATLIWHYTVDASLVGLFLLRSNSLYFKISGVIVGAAALAPLLFSAVSYFSRAQFEPVEDLLNGAETSDEIPLEPVAETPEVASPTRRYDALSPSALAFLGVCVLLGGGIAWLHKSPTIGSYLKLSVNAKIVHARADDLLRQRGIRPETFHSSTVLVDTTNPVINQFLRTRLSIAQINDIYAGRVPGALWRVRYFRDNQPEEYGVILKPDGSVHSIHHTLAEDAAGDSLPKEDAQARAEAFLRKEKNLDLSAWTLVEAASEKHPHRVDHTLTWQQNTSLDSPQSQATNDTDHAHIRIDVNVLGSEVTNYRTYIKIPDEWERKQTELTVSRVVIPYGVTIAVYLGLGIAALIIFLKNMRSDAVRSVPWKRITLWSFGALVGYLLVFSLGNTVAHFWNVYDTAKPYNFMLGTLAIGAVLGAPFYFVTVALLFGLAWYFAMRAFGSAPLPSWRGMPALYYRDGLCVAIGGTAGLIGVRRLLEAVFAHWPTMHRSLESAFGTNFDSTLPAAAILGSTIFRGLLLTGLVSLVAAFVAAQIPQRGFRILLFVAGTVTFIGGNWGSSADLSKQFLADAILLAVLVFGVRYVVRFNILGCFLLVALTTLLGGVQEMLGQSDSFYQANGYALLLVVLALLAWPLFAWRSSLAVRT